MTKMHLKTLGFKNARTQANLTESEKARLFSSKSPCIEVATFHVDRPQQFFLRSVDEIKDFFQKDFLESTCDAIIVLRQSSSWGHFYATSDMFQDMFATLDIFPDFLDFLRGFGFKMRSEDENFGGYREKPSARSFDFLTICEEFMYNLRYAAKHGRQRRNPWAIRHMAIYHRFNLNTQSSLWILLQPSEDSYNDLKKLYHDTDCRGQSGHRGLLHELFFWDVEGNWREYINYLQKELLVLEDKALLSRVGQKSKVDYELAFADCQDVQSLRNMMQKCRAGVKITQEAVAGFEWFLNNSRADKEANMDQSFFRSYNSLLRNHCQSIEDLLESSRGISQILFEILRYRNDETLIGVNNALRSNGEDMKIIAGATKDENEKVTSILAETRKDSHLMKILTFVAMIYLPATLIAQPSTARLRTKHHIFSWKR
ncbi:hypothetical protein EJ04DRAFT_565675 [Polyplosphaeria fusca]|uniref:CorA-like transporter domain-containing protein n=1 Tax=Polyplosphaeria fusca TaxID=682080 RepID=A0A9P4QWI7_9PLEO|nr:hypothetical protein EJ04DRAFT_565675 [Polyplosphaeria fusca]